MKYTPTIGLEIHAELKTETKMFCNSKNAPEGAIPNTHICPICMGHPGTLPTLNKKAIESVIKVGVALGSKIAGYTEFDRKNYFYPDIPKGYQISQYAYPLVMGGALCGVSITRVHLEEDTARSLHDQGEGSVIDYNRAGVPLMELVTEPVLHSAEEAGAFARELQMLLRSLAVSDANMEMGQMRVEANISISEEDSPAGTLGTKVEVKNLNSFKAVESAITYEIKRHTQVLLEGGSLTQETRGWDEGSQKTFSQRKKESSHDYRYFPDPDIPKLNTSAENTDLHISRIDEIYEIIPSNIRIKYGNLDLARNQIAVLMSNPQLRNFFDAVLRDLTEKELITLAVNYLTSDVAGLLAAHPSVSLHTNASIQFSRLISLVGAKVITSRVAKDLLERVVFEGMDSESLVQSLGLKKADREDIERIVTEVITEHATVVAEYRAGKVSSLQFLIGQGMRMSKGSADPAMLSDLFKERLS